MRGLAPTNTWEPYTLIRDPYSLAVPAGGSGPYRLLVGLYDAAGARAPLILADGTQPSAAGTLTDALTIDLDRPLIVSRTLLTRTNPFSL